MALDKPYSTGIFETIVDVHFGKPIYLVVAIGVGNASSSDGPFPPAPSIISPLQSSSATKPGVELLDAAFFPQGTGSFSGFNSCMTFLTGLDPKIAYELGLFGVFAAVNNACPWPGPGSQPPEISTTGINFNNSITITKGYLYRITPGEKLVKASVGHLMAAVDSGAIGHFGEHTNVSGGANITARVYSTVKGKVTKLSQLIDLHNDGKPRPTEDDEIILPNITSDNQGSFSVSVHLDKDKADAKTDNFGKSFQPYKVTLTPSAGTIDLG